MNILLSDKVIDFLDATREKSRAAEVSKLLEILAAEHFNNKGKNNNIKYESKYEDNNDPANKTKNSR